MDYVFTKILNVIGRAIFNHLLLDLLQPFLHRTTGTAELLFYPG